MIDEDSFTQTMNISSQRRGDRKDFFWSDPLS